MIEPQSTTSVDASLTSADVPPGSESNPAKRRQGEGSVERQGEGQPTAGGVVLAAPRTAAKSAGPGRAPGPRIIKRGLRFGMRLAAMSADRHLAEQPGITVLGYHQVAGPVPGAVNLKAGMFAEQLDWLACNTTVLSLSAAIDVLENPPEKESDRPLAVITFDDGTADFVERAVPLLVDYNLPATLYLATAFVEEQRSFWNDGTVLSWGALADAVSTELIDVGSHTHSHVLLDRVSSSVINDELDRSIDLIGERLGVQAEHFAYPKALGDGVQADLAVRARFRSAAIAGGGTNVPGIADPYRLARQPILVGDGLRWFTYKARGGLRLEGQVREHLDRYRYRAATH